MKLAPTIRVNAIAPGPVLKNKRQTEKHFNKQSKNTLLGRSVKIEDICKTAYLLANSETITGQVIAVDSGQSLNWKTPDIIGLMNKTNIIKLFEDKKKLKSKEIIFIKNYVCKAIIGYHSFEKTKPQKLRFNVEILSKQKKVIDGNINSVLNYEEIINKINFFLKKKYNFLESFANDFIYEIFKNKNVLNIKIKIEKLNIIKNTESVGIEFFKIRNDYEKL